MKSSLRKALLSFELKVRRREITDSYTIACNVLNLFTKAIKKANTVDEIKTVFKNLTQQLQDHFPFNVMINNVCSILKSRLNEELEYESSQTQKNNSSIPNSDKNRPFSQTVNKDLSELIDNPLEKKQKGSDFFIPKSHSKSFLNILLFQNPPNLKSSEVDSDSTSNAPEASCKVNKLTIFT